MKKTLLYLIAILTFVDLNAQETKVPSLAGKNSELKVGVLATIIGSGFDLEYEKLRTPSTSWGVNLVYASHDNNDYYDYYTDAFYRFYFNEKKEYGMNGFFAQAYINYLFKDYHVDYWGGPPLDDDYSTLGIGFGLGRKWTTSGGFTLQTVFTLGRNFTTSEYYDDVVPRFDIYFGYRF